VAESDAPFRVFVYEPRPSWASAFIRRSLEGDPRFAVSSVSYPSRGIAVRTGGTTTLADLAAVDVVAVGGLDRLSASDASALDRFMRERGGSVALLPDARVDRGPAAGLVPLPAPSEMLVDARAALLPAVPLPRIDASELLVFRRTPAGADVLARANGSNDPVVIVAPHGDGRVLFSGALDAWRSRAEPGVEFDRFWRSAFAALALATPPPLGVQVTPPVLRPGGQARVLVRARGLDGGISATLETGEMVRLWPEAERGVFSGAFAAPLTDGAHAIDVTVGGAAATRARGLFVVGGDVRSTAPGAPLALLAASHGGIDVGPDDLPALERSLRQKIVASAATTVRRPMRSPWWLLPFAACLGGEWWLRRRRGLR
jgi:hypothetical protein